MPLRQNTFGDAADFTRAAVNYALRPFLDIRYQRRTLVARVRGERMTIDTELFFRSENRTFALGTGVFSVETKSADGRRLAACLLRANGERPNKRCLKYCVDMAATG